MPVLSIDVPSAVAEEVFEAFWDSYPEGDKPTAAAAKGAFVKKKLVDHTKEVVRGYRVRQATRQAQTDAEAAAEPAIT